MSFDQLSSLEAGRRRGTGFADDPEFQRLSQDLMNKLFRLNGNNQRLSTEVAHLGTKRDKPRARERVQTLIEESREVFKEVGEGVKKIQIWEDVTPSQKYIQQKLTREFGASLTEFQNLQRQALERQKATVVADRGTVDAEGSSAYPEQPSSPQQEQAQELARLAAQDEVDFQEALIIEREEEIRNIEQGVGDLNVLFQQVAQIVSEQGEQLETIADNVENVRDDTRGGERELRAAARYQKNARSKACCLLLILAIIFTIVLLAIFVG